MTANATIFTGHVSNALRIPKAALRFHPRGQTSAQTVYVADEKGNPKAVPVKTGISDANHVELIGGALTEGQPVITGMAVISGISQGGAGSKKLGF
jgi:HlyD family secretion protein